LIGRIRPIGPIGLINWDHLGLNFGIAVSSDTRSKTTSTGMPM
jgi:hypothetical protein